MLVVAMAARCLMEHGALAFLNPVCYFEHIASTPAVQALTAAKRRRCRVLPTRRAPLTRTASPKHSNANIRLPPSSIVPGLTVLGLCTDILLPEIERLGESERHFLVHAVPSPCVRSSNSFAYGHGTGDLTRSEVSCDCILIHVSSCVNIS